MPISLLFGVHAHQPVGNFPAVIDDAHIRSYGMFLRVMERYPEFRFSVHFSGWLLDVLFERFPDDMARLTAMTRRGQVEWFGSGDCEPVLAAIPHRDRVTQITTLSDKIEKRFGMRPSGAWLTERVWESSVVTSLVATGIRYVAVDDYHFLCAGESQDRLDSFFSTDEDGRRLDLFPISEAARYRLPFSPAGEAVAWLEDLARQGRRAAIYFDDIEKFGIWRNFMSRYTEANWMHKRMLGASRRLAELPPEQRSPELQEYLHRAQANDAYWHGLFGGLYLPHLRRAIWNNLLMLEAALERLAPWPRQQQGDLDHDGHVETALRTPLIHAYVRDDGHASLVEFSSLAVAHNFGDTLRAYAEAYHAKIDQAHAAHTTQDTGEGITSAHDRVAFLHTILPGDADPDERPRGIFVDSVIGSNDMLRPLDFYAAGESPGTWAAAGPGWLIGKTYRLDGNTLSVVFRAEGGALPKFIETELNLALPSCDGYGGRYVLADGSVPGGFGEALELASMQRITLDDSELRGALQIEASQPVRLEAQPHRTVSQSEAGFEKIMQAVCITLAWSPASGVEQIITLKIIPAS